MKALLTALLLILLTFGSALADTPLPEDVTIIPPGADVPAAVARYSGTWTGYWSTANRQEVTIVIERIEPPNVYLINSWGFGGRSSAGYARYKGGIEDDRVDSETKTAKTTLVLHPAMNIINAEVTRSSSEAGKGIRFTAELVKKP